MLYYYVIYDASVMYSYDNTSFENRVDVDYNINGYFIKHHA